MSLANPNTSAQQVGRRIAQRRRELGITQQELADRLRISAAETISRYERGEREPRISTVARIAEALDYTLLEFLSGLPAAGGSVSGVPVTRSGTGARASAARPGSAPSRLPLADPPLMPHTPVAPLPRLEDVERVNYIASALGRMRPEERDIILSGVEAMIATVERVSVR